MVPASTLLGVFMSDTGLYIHIPFCKSKCNYCNFFSVCHHEIDYDTYTAQMLGLIDKYAERHQNRSIDTVYFGGGTPSVIGTKRLCRILSEIKSAFNVIDNAEITFEANPTSSDLLDFSRLYQAGFNRISFGLQSADQNELSVLGRQHTAEEAKAVIETAKEAGFRNISIDIMLAIPYQTEESLLRTISFCYECGVQHISAYILKIEEGTPFDKMRDRLELIDEDSQALLYEFTVRELERRGYHQYEISNFAKNGFESRHNLHYWHDEEYIGLGPSAHSFIDGERYYYSNSFEDFYNDKTVFESQGGDREEYIMLALRLREGLIFQKYEERFKEKIVDQILKRASSLLKENYIELDEKSLRLTVKGFLVSNLIIGYLLNNT